MSQETIDLSALSFIKDTDWRQGESAHGLPDRVSTLHQLCDTLPVRKPSSSDCTEPEAEETKWLEQTLTTLREVERRIIKVATNAEWEKGQIEQKLIPFFTEQSSRALSTWDGLRSFVPAMLGHGTAPAKPTPCRIDIGGRVISEDQMRRQLLPSVDRMRAAATQRDQVITDCNTVRNDVQKQMDEIRTLTGNIRGRAVQQQHDGKCERTVPTVHGQSSSRSTDAETIDFWDRLHTLCSSVKGIANSLDPDVSPSRVSSWVPDKGLVPPEKFGKTLSDRHSEALRE